MAYTTTQLEALQAALASGELRIQFEGREIEYRSVSELKDAIAEVQASIQQAAGTRKRQLRTVTSKGF